MVAGILNAVIIIAIGLIKLLRNLIKNLSLREVWFLIALFGILENGTHCDHVLLSSRSLLSKKE